MCNNGSDQGRPNASNRMLNMGNSHLSEWQQQQPGQSIFVVINYTTGEGHLESVIVTNANDGGLKFEGGKILIILIRYLHDELGVRIHVYFHARSLESF